MCSSSKRFVLLQILTTKCPDFEVHLLVYDELSRVTLRWYDPSILSEIVCLPLSKMNEEQQLFFIKQRDDYLRKANFIFDPKYKQNCDWHRPQNMTIGTATDESLRESSLSWTMNPGFPKVTNVDATENNISNTGRPIRLCTIKSSLPSISSGTLIIQY
jgi:hypothetical protein